MQRPADFAAVDDGPFTVFPHPYSNRFHSAAAASRAVAGFHVQVLAGKAIGAMVPVPASGAAGDNGFPAYLTDEGFLAGV